MKFWLLVTVALHIFIKEKKQYFVSSLDFFFVIFLCKRCLLGQIKRRGTLIAILRPPDIPTTPPTPQFIIFYTNFQHPCLSEPPRLFGILEHVFLKEIKCLEQNVRKKIDYKRPSNTKKMKRVPNIETEIWKLKAVVSVCLK